MSIGGIFKTIAVKAAIAALQALLAILISSGDTNKAAKVRRRIEELKRRKRHA